MEESWHQVLSRLLAMVATSQKQLNSLPSLEAPKLFQGRALQSV